MTITYRDPQQDPVSFGWTTNGGRTYSVKLHAKTDDPTIGPGQIKDDLLARLLTNRTFYRWPLVKPATEIDYGALLNSVKVSPRARLGKAPHGGQWQIQLDFGPVEPQENGMQSNPSSFVQSPFSAPPRVSWNDEEVKRSWPYDQDDEPFLNAAGEPLKDPPEVDDAYDVLTVVRNEQTFDFTLPGQFRNRCNLGTWLYWGDNQVRCKSIRPEREYSPDWGAYWVVTYTFQIRPEGWLVEVLNAGTKQLVSGVQKNIVIQGMPVSDPVPLNADGTWSTSVTPNYLTFRIYDKVSFDPLNIDESIFQSGFIY